ncbi:MAG: PxKF domain-containing protein [Egibacteraceae bacterium]
MKIKVKLSILAAAIAVAVAVPASASAALVGHWTLDEGAGTVANDSSGLGHHGTVLGSPAWEEGRFGQALGFEDPLDRVAVTRSTSLEPATPTVMAWVRRSGSPGNFKTIVAKGASGCIAASYGLYTGPGGGLQFYISDIAGESFVRSPAVDAEIWDGAWHHVAGSFDGTAVRLFVDGVQVSDGTPHSSPIDYGVLDSPELFLGHYDGCEGRFDYDGLVDDARVYDHALSQAEVADAMNEPQAPEAYSFEGFFRPVDNPPTMNVVNAGRGVPIKFSLDGDQGLDILAEGSPSSGAIACNDSAPLDSVEETVTAGNSALSYDARADQYTYVWKTAPGWRGSCRKLTVALDDGTKRTLLLKFR